MRMPPLTLLAILSACASSSEAPKDDTEGRAVMDYEACVADDWQRPPFDGAFAADGSFLGPSDMTVWIGATDVQLWGDEASYALLDTLMGPIHEDLSTRQGMLGITFDNSAACHRARTFTVWESEQALYAFVGGPAHGAAMVEAGSGSLGPIDLAQTGVWSVSSTGLVLTWDDHEAHLVRYGEQ
jgi:hypothetical protein